MLRSQCNSAGNLVCVWISAAIPCVPCSPAHRLVQLEESVLHIWNLSRAKGRGEWCCRPHILISCWVSSKYFFHSVNVLTQRETPYLWNYLSGYQNVQSVWRIFFRNCLLHNSLIYFPVRSLLPDLSADSGYGNHIILWNFYENHSFSLLQINVQTILCLI